MMCETAYAKLTAPPATESREVTAADIIDLRETSWYGRYTTRAMQLLEKLK